MMTNAYRMKLGISATSATLLLAGLLVGGLGLTQCLGQEAAAPAAAASEAAKAAGVARGYDFLAIAIAVGLACIGAGIAVGRVGSAALGAVVEKPELMGRALIFVGLAEGIAIYGLIFGILLLKQL